MITIQHDQFICYVIAVDNELILSWDKTEMSPKCTVMSLMKTDKIKHGCILHD